MAFSDTYIVRTEEFQIYFFWTFLFAYPLEHIISDQLHRQPAVIATLTPDQFPMRTPIQALQMAIDKTYLTLSDSMAFIYQAYLLNFRFHLYDALISRVFQTEMPEIQLLSCQYHSDDCHDAMVLTDPLLYFVLNQTHQSTILPFPQPDQHGLLGQSKQYNAYKPSKRLPNVFTFFLKPPYHPSNRPITALFTFLSQSVVSSPPNQISSTFTNQPPNNDFSGKTLKSNFIRCNPFLNTASASNVSINRNTNISSPSPLHPNPLNDFSTMFTQFFNNIIDRDAAEKWCVADRHGPHWADFAQSQTDFTQSCLRAFIEQSYQQFQNNIPTLYQRLFDKTLNSTPTTTCSCFLTFLLLAPLVAFRANANETDCLQVIPKHITLLAHASFLNPSSSTTSLNPLYADSTQYFERDDIDSEQRVRYGRHRFNRILTPIRAIIYSWLMIHSGLTQVFPTPPQDSSQGNLFWHTIDAVQQLCPRSDKNRMLLHTKMLKPFTPKHYNTLIDNPISMTANAGLMHDIEKLVMDKKGHFIYIALVDGQTTFPELPSAKKVEQAQEITQVTDSPPLLAQSQDWDNGITVIDFDSPFAHTPLAEYILKHKYSPLPMGSEDLRNIAFDRFDFQKWRNSFKHHGQFWSESWDEDGLGYYVDSLLPDSLLHQLFLNNAEVPRKFGDTFTRYLKHSPPILKLDYDYSIEQEFTQRQLDSIMSSTNQHLLHSSQILTFQRQYKTYLKKSLVQESDCVGKVLKDVLERAQTVGLLRIDSAHTDPLFKTYPFPQLPSITDQPSESPADLSSFQQWCVEMLLVTSLNIQPAFDPTVHTHIFIPQSQDQDQDQDQTSKSKFKSKPRNGQKFKKPKQRSISSIIDSFFLHPSRNWLSMLPHVEPLFHNATTSDLNNFPWFMMDSLFQIVAQVALATHSTLFSLYEDEPK